MSPAPKHSVEPDVVVEDEDEAGVREHADGLAEITQRLDELADLFVRRLADDRARRLAVEELSERLKQAELGPFRQYLHPFVQGMALVVDRLDRYDGPDPEFVGSIRAELLDLLDRYGVREIDVTEGFDPATQEAVDTGRDPVAPAGTVLEVRRTGFVHGSWVFRPAQVVVNAPE